ncbi:MAG: hypothetical protein ACOC13_02295 [Tangfeifania sp.]
MKTTILQSEILEVQKLWGNALVKIGEAYREGKDFKKLAENAVGDLYGYDLGNVLFKPTKAVDKQFRLTFESAVSYFVGGNAEFPEDKGFALQPWKNVRFENAGIIINNNSAFAMGNYFFTDYNNEETKVEYTFGYRKAQNGQLKIVLHHSSVPFHKP